MVVLIELGTGLRAGTIVQDFKVVPYCCFVTLGVRSESCSLMTGEAVGLVVEASPDMAVEVVVMMLVIGEEVTNGIVDTTGLKVEDKGDKVGGALCCVTVIRSDTGS